MENWVKYVLFSILFFVSGQVALKYENSKNSLISCCYFTISMGIVGLLTLLFLLKREKMNKKQENRIIYPIIAGIVFFFGNLFWVMSINNSPSLSLVRVIMAGGETLLLLIAGYLFFKQKLSLKDFIAILIILFGIFIINI